MWLFWFGCEPYHGAMSLRPNAILNVHKAIRCQQGLLWVTREGDARDYLLGPGQELSGRLVVQALTDSEVAVL